MIAAGEREEEDDEEEWWITERVTEFWDRCVRSERKASAKKVLLARSPMRDG
jgi:hypothetical protein